MKAITRQEAVDYANIVLESAEANSSERRLARYVLAMEALAASFVQEAEQLAAQARPRPDLERIERTCGTCGTVYSHSTLREAFNLHQGFQPGHPLLIWEGSGFGVITEGSLREIENPSGEIADRSGTGPNDPFATR